MHCFRHFCLLHHFCLGTDYRPNSNTCCLLTQMPDKNWHLS